MNTNETIKAFATFLNSSWDIATVLISQEKDISNDSLINNWIQSNWELLVERSLLEYNEFLEVYSDGADYYGTSSRMNDIEAIPTHCLKVLSKSGSIDILNNATFEETEFEFDRLVGFQNDFYTNSPPFNYALLIDSSGSERVLSLESVVFELNRI